MPCFAAKAAARVASRLATATTSLRSLAPTPRTRRGAMRPGPRIPQRSGVMRRGRVRDGSSRSEQPPEPPLNLELSGRVDRLARSHLTPPGRCKSLARRFERKEHKPVALRLDAIGQRSETVRRANLGAIARELHARGPLSRSELVAATGLTRSAI